MRATGYYDAVANVLFITEHHIVLFPSIYVQDFVSYIKIYACRATLSLDFEKVTFLISFFA